LASRPPPWRVASTAATGTVVSSAAPAGVPQHLSFPLPSSLSLSLSLPFYTHARTVLSRSLSRSLTHTHTLSHARPLADTHTAPTLFPLVWCSWCCLPACDFVFRSGSSAAPL
jgi:hypothetical protein